MSAATARLRGYRRPLLVVIGAAFVVALTVACGGAERDSSDQMPTPQTVEGVWEGSLRGERAGSETPLCLQVGREESGTAGVRVSGVLYLDGELEGIVAGTLDPDGAIIFSGGSDVGTFVGTVEGESAFGTWTRSAPDVVPAGGGWSAEKAERKSCE